MYPRAVSGDYKNNNKFSDCSKHAILPTLLKKAEICFEEESESFCGNYKVLAELSCVVCWFLGNSDQFQQFLRVFCCIQCYI